MEQVKEQGAGVPGEEVRSPEVEACLAFWTWLVL